MEFTDKYTSSKIHNPFWKFDWKITSSNAHIKGKMEKCYFPEESITGTEVTLKSIVILIDGSFLNFNNKTWSRRNNHIIQRVRSNNLIFFNFPFSVESLYYLLGNLLARPGSEMIVFFFQSNVAPSYFSKSNNTEKN